MGEKTCICLTLVSNQSITSVVEISPGRRAPPRGGTTQHTAIHVEMRGNVLPSFEDCEDSWTIMYTPLGVTPVPYPTTSEQIHTNPYHQSGENKPRSPSLSTDQYLRYILTPDSLPAPNLSKNTTPTFSEHILLSLHLFLSAFMFISMIFHVSDCVNS